MEKKRLKIQNKEGYCLGLDKDGERFYLMLPSWDCGWYWGCGYLSVYRGTRNTENNYSMHTHFKGHIIGDQEIYNSEKRVFVKTTYTHHLNEVLKETVLNDSDSWKLSELINSMELLGEMADFYQRGGSHITENPLKDSLKRLGEYKFINKVLLPKIFNEIDKLLKGEKQKTLEIGFFEEQVKLKS